MVNIPNFAPDQIPDINNPDTFHDDATYVFSHLNNNIIPTMNTNINEVNATITGVDDNAAAALASENNAATSETNAAGSALAAAASAQDAQGGLAYVTQNSAYETKHLEGVIADTSAGEWTLTLPANPNDGDYVVVSDGADWSINNLTLFRNGSSINGDTQDLILGIGKVTVTLVYSFNDWKVYTQLGKIDSAVVTEEAPQTLSNKVIDASQLTGDLPAIDASNLTGISSPNTFDAVGTYVWGKYNTQAASPVNTGATTAGSNIIATNGGGYNSAANNQSMSGTWRVMGYLHGPATNGSSISLFIRIS